MQNITKRFPVRVNPVLKHASEMRISLSGDWRFRLDPDERGETEKWYDYPFLFLEHIKVPGCWQGQGFGDDGTDTHKETMSEARAFRATYKGTGWYLKVFTVPAEWKNKRIWLNFGGANPTAKIWVNGTFIGENHAPYVPFGFDITELISLDGDNTIVARISEDDAMLSFNYRYTGIWSGLYRDVELSATDAAYIDSFSLLPNEKTGELTVKAVLCGGALIVRSIEGLTRPFEPVQHLEVGRYFFTKPASYPPYEELQSGTIIKDHPLFGDIPHGKYADLMFYNMIGESPALDLEPLGLNDADPVIRMIHAYQVSRSLGYIAERRLGDGLIIITSLDICDKYPESMYLLSQMIKYAESGKWTESPQITKEAVARIISGTNL